MKYEYKIISATSISNSGLNVSRVRIEFNQQMKSALEQGFIPDGEFRQRIEFENNHWTVVFTQPVIKKLEINNNTPDSCCACGKIFKPGELYKEYKTNIFCGKCYEALTTDEGK